MVALLEPEDDQEQRDGAEHDAQDVEAVRVGRQLRHETPREDEGDDTDRDVHEEDPLPAEAVDEQTARERPDEGGDTAAAHATFDQLRAEYVDLYEEAAASSRSTAEHARHQARRRALHDAAAEGTSKSLADRVPHDVRAAIPPSVRRGVRKALGRTRDATGDPQP